MLGCPSSRREVKIFTPLTLRLVTSGNGSSVSDAKIGPVDYGLGHGDSGTVRRSSVHSPGLDTTSPWSTPPVRPDPEELSSRLVREFRDLLRLNPKV